MNHGVLHPASAGIYAGTAFCLVLMDIRLGKIKNHMANMNRERGQSGTMNFNRAIRHWLLPVLLRSGQDAGEDLNSVPKILQAQVFVGAVLVVVMVHNGQADHRRPEQIGE